MQGRKDALAAASRFVIDLQEVASQVGGVATVGKVSVLPGAANVIPSSVTLSVDMRAAQVSDLNELRRSAVETAQAAAARSGCEARHRERWCSAPIPMSAEIGQVIR